MSDEGMVTNPHHSSLITLLLPSYSAKAVDEIKHHYCNQRHDDGEREGFVIASGLNSVIDSYRSSLRSAGNIAGNHDGDTKVAQSACEGESRGGEHTTRG